MKRLMPEVSPLFVRTTRKVLIIIALFTFVHGISYSQSIPTLTIKKPPQFQLQGSDLKISSFTQASHPFTVTGERGAILGKQDGTFELWILPSKILHNARLSARLEGYGALIDLNQQSSMIEVFPDHTTITYSHAAITVKQHMFIPRTSSSGIASAVVLFEIHAIRPAEVVLSFEPSLERQWPAPNFGRPNGAWVPMVGGGGYMLETDNPNFYGMVAMPGSTPGMMRPFQEYPKTEPLEFHIHYDPAKDDAKFYPLLAGVANPDALPVVNGKEKLKAAIAEASAHVPEMYASTADFYKHFFDTRLTIESPDTQLNEALRWAEVSIEQAKVASPTGYGLAGGWFISGDSARPGFGWFFGRDTLWTLYAVNSYGDFNLSKQSMDFLLAHQRADGKMMHEFSQTADLVDWQHLPYLYAAADATPLFLMQMADYVRSSGDTQYLKQHWNSVKSAYEFTRAHTTDGMYDNSQGTGWVEEWVPEMPQQEVYLAAVDEQGSLAMAMLAGYMKDDQLSERAQKAAEIIRKNIKQFHGADDYYYFARKKDGSFDKEPTIFPAVAWWDGTTKLDNSKNMLNRWGSHTFLTDWGTRSMEVGATTYDPISYHHGSVWPLYTGWTSMAEYRSGNALAGFEALQHNISLTWQQDLGAITEVLSGEYMSPLGRSSSHQLWSSAMTITPAIRGLFGVQANAVLHTLYVNPQLPAEWNNVKLKNFPFGSERLDLTMDRRDGKLMVDVMSQHPSVLCLSKDVTTLQKGDCSQAPSIHHTLTFDLPAYEVSLSINNPQPGQRTEGWKVIDQEGNPHGLKLILDGPAGSTGRLKIVNNKKTIKLASVSGATLVKDELIVEPSTGETGSYQQHVIELKW